MAGSEAIRLDPSAVATGRTELDITQYVALDGVDWGDAQVEQYMAERGGFGGAIPIDFRTPNRTVTMPLRLQTRGTVTFDQIRSKLQSKAALFQAEGGWLGRVTSSGGTVFADVTSAQLKFGGGWGQARGKYDENAELVLECLPDWYGDEVTLSTHDESSLPELVWTETGILGDYPGRVRFVVTDRQGQDQLGLIWGFRSRNYSSATTAKLAYEAEALTPLDAAAIASLSGASGAGSNTMQHANLTASWTAVMNTNLLAGTYLTHVGSYRVWARVYSTSGDAVRLRFVYDVGDMTNPTENAAWEFPAASQFYMADLGEIRLDKTTGTHRWQGVIQAKGDAGGESVRIDRLFFQPLDEAAGRLAAPISAAQGLSAYSARDEFNQSAGALTGKTAPTGGTWAGAGDADDFALNTTDKTARRTALSDSSSASGGRYVVLGSSITDTVVQTNIKYSSPGIAGTNWKLGVLARYADTNNWLYAAMALGGVGNGLLYVNKRVGGTVTTLFQSGSFSTDVTGSFPTDTWKTLRLLVDARGNWYVWYGNPEGKLALAASGQDSALASAGALASGKGGLYDGWADAGASNRDYDNFAVWVPNADAVAFSNQPVELATEGLRRKDSTGTAYGPVTFPTGDNPRIPVAGVEGRTVEGFVKCTRGDFDQLPDAGIDDVRAQLYYRPTWLYLPDDTGS